jgi:surfeit locus 1 family protein
VLTAVFVAINVRLGNWQGERAEYRIDQQSQLDAALATAPLAITDIGAGVDPAQALRYRALSVTGFFVADELFYVDNRIVDRIAGYGLLQSFRVDTPSGVSRTLLVDRGWIKISRDRGVLPDATAPVGTVTIIGRINSPPSRNPGTFDNDGGRRLNYVNIAEISTRLGRDVEPFVLEQTAGPGLIAFTRSPPGANSDKNRGYQLQWYAFAALSIILFLVLSFRKVDAV